MFGNCDGRQLNVSQFERYSPRRASMNSSSWPQTALDLKHRSERSDYLRKQRRISACQCLLWVKHGSVAPTANFISTHPTGEPCFEDASGQHGSSAIE